MGHHPAIIYSNHGADALVNERIVPLLESYGFSLYLSAHDHNMQMLHRRGVHYTVLGAASTRLYRVRNGPETLFAAATQGYGLLRVTRDRMVLEFCDTSNRILYDWQRDRAGAIASLEREP